MLVTQWYLFFCEINLSSLLSYVNWSSKKSINFWLLISELKFEGDGTLAGKGSKFLCAGISAYAPQKDLLRNEQVVCSKQQKVKFPSNWYRLHSYHDNLSPWTMHIKGGANVEHKPAPTRSMTTNTPIPKALELVLGAHRAVQVHQRECKVFHAYTGLAFWN